MEIITFIIKISRPRFWLYLAGPLLIGFASFYQSFDIFINIEFYVMLLYFLIPANIYLYGINDYFDVDTDAINPKKEKQELRLNDEKKRKLILLYSFIFLLLSLVLIYLLPNFKTQLLSILFIFLATFYSAPPLRFKSKIFLDFISNVLYLLPALIAYTFLSNDWPELSIILACALWTFGMHLFSAIPDIEFDKKAKLKTSAVFLGEKISLLLCTIFWLLFYLLIIYNDLLPLFNIILIIYPFLPLFLLLRKEKAEKIYWYFPLINAAIGFLTFWYILIY